MESNAVFLKERRISKLYSYWNNVVSLGKDIKNLGERFYVLTTNILMF